MIKMPEWSTGVIRRNKTVLATVDEEKANLRIVVLYRDTHKKRGNCIFTHFYRLIQMSNVLSQWSDYIYKKSLFTLQIQLIKRAQEPNYPEKICTARKTVSPSSLWLIDTKSVVYIQHWLRLSKSKEDLIKCTDLTGNVYILPLGEGVQVPPFLQ